MDGNTGEPGPGARQRAADDARLEYETLVRTCLDGFFMADLGGRFLDVNETLARMLGYTVPELLQMSLQDIEAAETAEQVTAHIGAVVAVGLARFETVHRHKDGSDIPVEVSVTVSPSRRQVLVFVRDLRPRREAEAALRASEARYRALFTSMKEGFALHEIITDDSGRAVDYRFLDVNPAFEGITGVARERWIGRTVREILPAIEPVWVEMYGRVALTGEPVQFEDHNVDLDRWFQVFAFCPAPRQFAVLVIDITERKQIEAERRRLEAQVHRSHRLESLGGLAGGVAHDMNNVLGAILGLATVHMDTHGDDEPLRQGLETIAKACVRGGTMLRSLLDFARSGLAEQRVVDINAIVQDEVRLLERTTLARIDIRTDLVADPLPIKGDAGALSHALLNVCLNAADAMPDGGTLTIVTRNLGSNRLRLTIADTGCGMPPEVVEKALDPFFTTKPQGKGTGLGLSIVYGTVKAHGGQLEIQSEPGRGTEVSITLPACRENPPAAEPAADDAAGPRAALHILLVDDDDLVRVAIEAQLRRLGHVVTSTPSGEAALSVLEAGLAVDAVLLDVNMPGLGGAGTLPRLRTLRPDVPVVLATGRADQRALDLMAAFTQVTMLQKPFGIDELRSHLDTIRPDR